MPQYNTKILLGSYSLAEPVVLVDPVFADLLTCLVINYNPAYHTLVHRPRNVGVSMVKTQHS